MKKNHLFRKLAAGLLSAAVLLSTAPAFQLPVAAAEAEKATLTVNMDPAVNTGDIIHGAAGFLYGVSSEDVPTTNTIVPLKSKILVTKGALGTEHPYGDALDVAKTFLESGGQQIQMYNSNYYGVFGVTATIDQYCNDLINYICPAVVGWKEAWKADHGTPENPKDNIGATIDIDKAIVYVPINEGTPNGGNFQNAWKSFYEAIKSVDTNASLAGPNGWGYNGGYTGGQSEKTFIQFCANNNCMPDVYTWHELSTGSLRDMSAHMDDFRKLWANNDWTKYNEVNGTEGIPEIPQVCFNEYAEMDFCGVPGRLVNWISRIEDEKVTGCLPFWHQANNLNDLASDANEGNGAWWLYKWYGDMSGVTQPVSTSTSYEKLYGISTMDENKKSSTTLLGGFKGDITVRLNNANKTETFAQADKVHVKVQVASFTGFHGSLQDTPTILEGTYPVNPDGSVVVEIDNAKFEDAYNITLTQADPDAIVDQPLSGVTGTIYEAENGAVANGAQASNIGTNPSFYMSNDGTSNNRGVKMPQGGTLTYTFEIPADGKYKLDFNYGNGTGSNRNDMNRHKPVNIEQTYSLDNGADQAVIMKSTLFESITGTMTLYYDLTAGTHTIAIKTTGAGNINHDFMRVTYAGVYGKEVPLFDKVYEAEQADFNKLLGNADTKVKTESALNGYSSNGYVTGLSDRLVSAGGGIRNTVVVEKSGLYNITLRYQAPAAGSFNIYVGNTAVTLDRVNKTVAVNAADGWTNAAATIYLQKGINVVDIDATMAASLDYMRVQALPEQSQSTVIEAEDCIPAGSENVIKTAQSVGASDGTYVVGMLNNQEGTEEENAKNYLEIIYNAPKAGKYQMQVFHSNDDICGSHSYNIKVTDKYATFEVNGKKDEIKTVDGNLAENFPWSIDLRNQSNKTSRYFFINSFSDDTFKEKTITLDLKEGENKIKVYNDNSWNVTYGGAQNLPGLNKYVNYTPNFDKFIITPMALDNAVELENTYRIDIFATKGGSVIADQNEVAENGSYTLTMKAEAGYEMNRLMVNGIDRVADIEQAADGVYTLTVDQVAQNQTAEVYFSKPGASKATLQAVYQAYEALEQGQFTDSTWDAFVSARDYAAMVVGKENVSQYEINNAYDGLIYAVNRLAVVVIPVYFVDCGDHNPGTLSAGDRLGTSNSVTDQMYGPDAETGYSWGVDMLDEREEVTPGGSVTTPTDDDKGVYTNFQKALSNGAGDLADGQPKEKTYRYAHNQDGAGINPRYVAYKFELDPGVYEFTVCVGNNWGNSANPDVYANGTKINEQRLGIPTGGNKLVNGSIEIKAEEGAETGILKLQALSSDATINMNYILIKEKTTVTTESLAFLTQPEKTSYQVGETLDTTGMLLKVDYSDGSTKVLTAADCEISGYDANQAGTQTVTVAFGGKSVSYEITVTGESKLDKSLLKDSIDLANIAKENYPANLIEAVRVRFEAALAHAIQVYNDTSDKYTQADVDMADDELVRMLQYLRFTADIDGLKAAIDHAKEVIASNLYENDAMMDAYKKALADAEALLAEGNITDTEIQPVVKALADAETKLNEAVNKLELSRLLREINLGNDTKQLLHLYFDGAEKDDFTAELAEAEALLKTAQDTPDKVTQEQIDAETSKLHKTRMALRLIPNKEALKTLIDSANAIDQSLYTEASVRDLQAALNAANTVYADDKAGETAVRNAERELQAAIGGLVLRTGDGGNANQGDKNDSTQTGDTTHVAMFGLLLLASAGALILLRKKAR